MVLCENHRERVTQTRRRRRRRTTHIIVIHVVVIVIVVIVVNFTFIGYMYVHVSRNAIIVSLPICKLIIKNVVHVIC